MEFYKTKLFGGEVDVLFTGPNYFFFHCFYGVICIAERVFDEESSNQSDTDEYKSKFVLYSGHKNGDGIERESFNLAKRIIRKYDQKYVKKTFEFEEVVTDLSRCHVEVSCNLNHFR